MFVQTHSMNLAALAVKFSDPNQARALFDAARVLNETRPAPAAALEAGLAIIGATGRVARIYDQSGQPAERLLRAVADEMHKKVLASVAGRHDYAGQAYSLASQLKTYADTGSLMGLIEAIGLRGDEQKPTLGVEAGEQIGGAEIRAGAPFHDVSIQIVDDWDTGERRFEAVLRATNAHEAPMSFIAPSMAELLHDLKAALKEDLHATAA